MILIRFYKIRRFKVYIWNFRSKIEDEYRYIRIYKIFLECNQRWYVNKKRFNSNLIDKRVFLRIYERVELL